MILSLIYRDFFLFILNHESLAVITLLSQMNNVKLNPKMLVNE